MDRSEAAEDTGTEDGCERSLAVPGGGFLACDPDELHDENNAFRLERKF